MELKSTGEDDKVHDQWKELRERFSKLTDEELLKIVTVEAAGLSEGGRWTSQSPS
jgi:hypothetical protein